jgi:hypothetical protein
MAGSLPDLKRLDADALQALLLAAHSELEIAREQLLSRDQEVEYLKLQLAKLRRMLFGRSSEKVAQQIEQLELRLEDLETDSRSLYASNPNGDRPNVIQVSLADGSVKPAVDLSAFKSMPGRIDTWFGVTPDDSIIFLRWHAPNEIYALTFVGK